jgi:hypothetical protein
MIIRRLSALIAAALVASSLAPARAATSLADLEAQYYRARWTMEPTSATAAGIHDFDTQLADYSAQGYARRALFAHQWLARLNGLSTATPDDRYDVAIWKGSLERELMDVEESQTWRHNPALYTSAASYAIYGLFSRDFAPLTDRMRSALARESAIPAMLAAAAANVTTVDPITAKLAAANMRGTFAFFRDTVPTAFADVKDDALQAQFKPVNDAVVLAVQKYIDAETAGPLAHPSGTFAIGSDQFARRLALQEGRALPLATYERVGMAALSETRNAFIALAKQIDPTKTPQQVADALGADHPAADDLVGTAQREIATLRAFVEAKHLVTLPIENNVLVRETPIFNRETSFASMNTPGAFEKNATQAYYYVTPVDPKWTAAQTASHLGFFNNYAFPIVTAHEVMPGHYVNFVLHKTQHLSMVRALSGNPSYSEGWAHYCEQMMVDNGWGNGDPKVRLSQLQQALQREARYIIGLREHTQGMTVEQAAAFFHESTFYGEAPSQREALRGTQDPLYGYYTLGKLEILKLRADYQKKMGAAYTLQGFHDAFLAHGNPPIGIMRQIMLGKDDDGTLL